MNNLTIALVAEDDTDCETIRRIVWRVLGKKISTRKWSSKGCSTLRRKLQPKLRLLSNAGCNAFVIVHDLDRNPQNNSLNDEVKLRVQLEQSTPEVASQDKCICIPIEELEAWFWSDPEVVRHVGRGKGKAERNPNKIERPKEKLIRLSIGATRRPHYSTADNPELAEMLNLDLCSQRCRSFRELLGFLRSLPCTRLG